MTTKTKTKIKTKTKKTIPLTKKARPTKLAVTKESADYRIDLAVNKIVEIIKSHTTHSGEGIGVLIGCLEYFREKEGRELVKFYETIVLIIKLSELEQELKKE